MAAPTAPPGRFVQAQAVHAEAAAIRAASAASSAVAFTFAAPPPLVHPQVTAMGASPSIPLAYQQAMAGTVPPHTQYTPAPVQYVMPGGAAATSFLPAGNPINAAVRHAQQCAMLQHYGASALGLSSSSGASSSDSQFFAGAVALAPPPAPTGAAPRRGQVATTINMHLFRLVL